MLGTIFHFSSHSRNFRSRLRVFLEKTDLSVGVAAATAFAKNENRHRRQDKNKFWIARDRRQFEMSKRRKGIRVIND